MYFKEIKNLIQELLIQQEENLFLIQLGKEEVLKNFQEMLVKLNSNKEE